MTEPPRGAGPFAPERPRIWLWLQLLLGWVPVWALYTTLISTAHQVSWPNAALLAVRSLVPAALLGLLVHRLVRRTPWPRPFRSTFLLLHILAAATYAFAWIAATSIVESVLHGRMLIVVGPGIAPFFVMGIWLYVMVAGVSYAIEGTARAARAEAASVRMQLAALRAHLHPHFLFNALHTVVQLIPSEPARASEAAEQVAALLRTALEDGRDLVPLRDEWTFVSRYLDIERIRFAERLRVHADLDPALSNELVPSFALQTLVENAVRHGAAPRVQPTDITISATSSPTSLTIEVRDTGAGVGEHDATSDAGGNGTGLARLRDRLAVLYGDAAALVLQPGTTSGFSATLILPRAAEE